MAFARNRIGVNYHKLDKHEKSLENHKMNIELSDIENIFAGYYNAGISCRSLGNHREGLDYFNRALEWSLSKQVKARLQ
jgi:tetratricopeptide (TPR) repeat protein